MNILPTLQDVEKIAATGQYKVLPVSCEILSDICTPIEAIKILKNISTHCYMLESVAEKERWGRYTFLGFDPRLEVTCMDGQMRAGNITLKTDHPSDFLRQILADYKSPRFDYLPSFTGGLVGYFSYDYTVMNEIMSSETTPTQNAAFLAALSTKSAKAETTQEIAGCAAAMRDHATRVDTGMDVFEIVGTGGDNAGSFNISTTSALVEAHDEKEVKMALNAGARIIGVNNRNLKDFTVDTENSRKLRNLIPADVLFVSESGVRSAGDVNILREIGADAPEHVGAYVKSMKDALR